MTLPIESMTDLIAEGKLSCHISNYGPGFWIAFARLHPLRLKLPQHRAELLTALRWS